MWDTYTWIFVCSIFLALFVAWGIGANDVANAFSTSVGARALTMKQAIVVASFCEFGGAVLLGSGVTDTIKSGIAKVSAYTYEPELLMYGMLCALLAAGIWLALATYLELPVSTTHSIVGAIIGMSLVAAGPDSIIWTSSPKPGSPFPGGVVSIVLAWFITPTMAALVAGLLFWFTKVVVLKAKNPFRRSLYLFPVYTFITIWVVTYFIIQKGVNGWIKGEKYGSPGDCPPASEAIYKTSSSGTTTFTGNCTIPDGTNAWISTVTAAVVTLISIISLKWIIKLVEHDLKVLEAAETDFAQAAAAHGNADPTGEKAADNENGAAVAPVDLELAGGQEQVAAAVLRPSDATEVIAQLAGKRAKFFGAARRSKVWTGLTYGSNYDIHKSVADDAKIMAMHNEAEVFDRKTELSFKYLQVCTACANSFAHGANDVANSIGSFAAIYAIWECSCANSKSNVPIWMFVIGGVGLVIGLATYGYRIMRALGVKMTKLTNSRGYCAELTAAIIVIVSSRYGFPVSTTQVITGAITGVGLEEVISAKLRGEKHSGQRFNFMLLFKFFCGWVATLIVAGLTSAAFTAQGIYAPSRPSVDARAQFNTDVNTTNLGIAQTLLDAGNVPAPTPAQAQAATWGKAILNATQLTWKTNNATMLSPNTVLSTFQQGSWYLGNSTIAGVLDNVFMPILPEVDENF